MLLWLDTNVNNMLQSGSVIVMCTSLSKHLVKLQRHQVAMILIRRWYTKRGVLPLLRLTLEWHLWWDYHNVFGLVSTKATKGRGGEWTRHHLAQNHMRKRRLLCCAWSLQTYQYLMILPIV
jgi:hypothetical protein